MKPAGPFPGRVNFLRVNSVLSRKVGRASARCNPHFSPEFVASRCRRADARRPTKAVSDGLVQPIEGIEERQRRRRLFRGRHRGSMVRDAGHRRPPGASPSSDLCRYNGVHVFTSQSFERGRLGQRRMCGNSGRFEDLLRLGRARDDGSHGHHGTGHLPCLRSDPSPAPNGGPANRRGGSGCRN